MHRLRTLLTGRASLTLLAMGLAVGYAVSLLGWRPLDARNTDWLFGDTATYYIGWSLYRHDPHVTFPLAWTDRVGYPFGASIALFDAIPLVAVLLRPLGPILPDPLQYLGPYATLCFVLQAYFGFRLCQRLFPSHHVFSFLGSLFFLLSPPLTLRALGHTALMSQWTILAALDAYFREPGDRPARWLGRLWIVLAIAAGLNPYIAVMCLLIVLAAVGRLAIERRCRWGQLAFSVAFTVGVFFASAALFGLLVGGANAYAPGYGMFSLNLNAPLNPMDHGSILLPALPVTHPFQYDAYCYLGLGTIALLVTGLVLRPESLRLLTDRTQRSLVVLALVATALAVSTSVSFGSSTLFTVTLPAAIAPWLENLRASGRLFWPAYYLIVLAALAVTFRAWTASRRSVVVFVLLAVQFVDLSHLRADIHERMQYRIENPLRSSFWTGLGRRYDNLILIPAHQCDPFTNGAGGINGYVWFGKLAAAERLRTNSYYAARYSSAELSTHCDSLLRAQLEGTLDPRSVYVVTEGTRTIWGLAAMRSHECQLVDGYNVCTPADPREPSPEPPPVPSAAAYVPGEALDFRLRKSIRKYMTFGWAPGQPSGTPTFGPLAMLRMGLEGRVDSSRDLLLEIEAMAQPDPARPRSDVAVVVNGHAVDHWTFESAAVTRKQARIPAAVVTSRDGLDIELRFPDVGLSPRLFFGLTVRSLVVRPD